MGFELPPDLINILELAAGILGVSEKELKNALIKLGINSREEVERLVIRPHVNSRIVIKLKNRPTVRLKPLVRLRNPNPRIHLRPATEEVISAEISIRSNEMAKIIFVSMLRSICGTNDSKIIKTEKNYTHHVTQENAYEQWFTINDLKIIANRYALPFVAISMHNHWNLLLKAPYFKDGEWKALVYDPMKNGQHEISIAWPHNPEYNWKLNLPVFACSNVALRMLTNNPSEYNLSLDVEPKSIIDIKGASKQHNPNWWDCGPICLFQAMLLAGVVKTDSKLFQTYRTNGINLIEQELWIEILTRDEIFSAES